MNKIACFRFACTLCCTCNILYKDLYGWLRVCVCGTDICGFYVFSPNCNFCFRKKRKWGNLKHSFFFSSFHRFPTFLPFALFEKFLFDSITQHLIHTHFQFIYYLYLSLFHSYSNVYWYCLYTCLQLTFIFVFYFIYTFGKLFEIKWKEKKIYKHI